MIEQKQGLCQNCNDTFLVPQNDQLYCSNCEIYRNKDQLEQQMLFVPNGYRPNTQRKQTSRQIRVSSLLQALIERYKICSGSELRFLTQQFERYRSTKKKCQSYEAVCAVIFFYQYREDIRKTIKDFAIQNGIERQQFNRCFIQYSQKKSDISNTTDQSIEPQTTQTILEQCNDFLKIIAKDLFSKIIRNKLLFPEIIEAIMAKIQKHIVQEQQIYPIVCLIFRALKQLKFKISIRSFAKICKQHGKPTSPASILKYQKDNKQYSKQGSSDKATVQEVEEYQIQQQIIKDKQKEVKPL